MYPFKRFAGLLSFAVLAVLLLGIAGVPAVEAGERLPIPIGDGGEQRAVGGRGRPRVRSRGIRLPGGYTDGGGLPTHGFLQSTRILPRPVAACQPSTVQPGPGGQDR